MHPLNAICTDISLHISLTGRLLAPTHRLRDNQPWTWAQDAGVFFRMAKVCTQITLSRLQLRLGERNGHPSSAMPEWARPLLNSCCLQKLGIHTAESEADCGRPASDSRNEQGGGALQGHRLDGCKQQCQKESRLTNDIIQQICISKPAEHMHMIRPWNQASKPSQRSSAT